MTSNPLIFIAITCLILAGGGVMYSALVSFGMMLATVHIGKKKVKEYCMVLDTDLPGKNCGACGYSKCSVYAEAMLFQEADCKQCPFCDAATVKELKTTVTRYWFLVETSNIPLAERTMDKKGKKSKIKIKQK